MSPSLSPLRLAALALPLLLAAGASHADPAAAELKVGVPQQFGYFAAIWQRNEQPPGVKADYKYFPDPTDLNDAILAGAVDIEDQGEIGPIQMAAGGSKVKVVACTGSNGRNTNLIVRPNVDAQTFADLRGRRIAYAQNNNHKLFVMHLLKRYGMQEADIKSVNILGAEAVSAFVAGQVDATSQNSPTAAQIIEKVPGSRVIATGEENGISNLYCVLATDNAVRNKAPQIRAFLAAYQSTITWSKAHRGKYGALVAPKLGVSEHAALVALDNNAGRLVPIDEAFIAEKQAYADELFAAGIIRKRIDAHDLFVTEFNDVVGVPEKAD